MAFTFNSRDLSQVAAQYLLLACFVTGHRCFKLRPMVEMRKGSISNSLRQDVGDILYRLSKSARIREMACYLLAEGLQRFFSVWTIMGRQGTPGCDGRNGSGRFEQSAQGLLHTWHDLFVVSEEFLQDLEQISQIWGSGVGGGGGGGGRQQQKAHSSAMKTINGSLALMKCIKYYSVTELPLWHKSNSCQNVIDNVQL